MTMSSRARFLGAFLASSALIGASQIAFANGQGTPVEEPPAPAPTTMIPEPAPAPPPVSEPAMVPNWSGFYVGGAIGYSFSSGADAETLLFDRDLNGSFDDTITTATGANAFSPGFCNGTPLGNNAGAGCEEDDEGGFEAGVRLGYDWQSGGFVYGGLIEASYVDIEDSVTGFSTTPAAYTFTRELNFLGAARLRAGFVAGENFLIYGTGGVAYGDIEHSFTTTNTVNSFTPGDDEGAWGWQLGAGAEAKISDNMSLGLEYLFTSLDDGDFTERFGPGTAAATNPFLLGNALGTDVTRSEDKLELHSVRAVLNYRFGE